MAGTVGDGGGEGRENGEEGGSRRDDLPNCSSVSAVAGSMGSSTGASSFWTGMCDVPWET